MTKFGDFLKSTVSRTAAAIASLAPKQVMQRAEPKWHVTDHIGKKGAPYRRIVRTLEIPARMVHTGYDKNGVPTFKPYKQNTFLHATKGWRTYSGGGLPGLARSSTPTLPRYPFCESQCHRMRGVTVANKKNAPRVRLGWRPAIINNEGRVIPVEAWAA